MFIIIFLNFQFSYTYADGKTEKEVKRFRYNEVECSYSKALVIAEKAALDKFPEYKEIILGNRDSGFSERHGGGEPETIIREYIIEYKDIEKYKGRAHQYTRQTEKGTMYYHGSYYKDAINVTLNNACEVVDVSRQKGTSYYVY